VYLNQSEKNIQDLLFMENRDRHYEPDIYKLRGHYRLSDNDFNLSQFGIFLNNDQLFITFHINDMIERMGRKLLAGDVLEMPNLKDYWPLDDAVPASLKKFYVVSEVIRAAEGYSPTWWPHLYRVKVNPMVDSQEFKEILDQEAAEGSDSTLRDILSPYLKNLEIDQAIVMQANVDVPASGYETKQYFVLPVDGNGVSLQNYVVANNLVYTTDINGNVSVNANVATPIRNTVGYLVGDKIAPNGLTVRSLTYFPDNPVLGQYILRLDYLPNVLYRWNGNAWQVVNDVVRSQFTGNNNTTQLGTFVNNTRSTTLSNGLTVDQRQALSKMLLPKSDV
jgi:RNA:NAD 2'-phosphotransferase (TPT1/KptA family)